MLKYRVRFMVARGRPDSEKRLTYAGAMDFVTDILHNKYAGQPVRVTIEYNGAVLYSHERF